MGSAKLQLQSLELNRVEEMTIRLEDAQRANKDLGEIRLNVTLWPKTQEDKEQVGCFRINSNTKRRISSREHIRRWHPFPQYLLSPFRLLFSLGTIKFTKLH